MVEYLSNMHEALQSFPSTEKKEKKYSMEAGINNDEISILFLIHTTGIITAVLFSQNEFLEVKFLY